MQEYAKRYAGQVVNNVVDVIITNTGVKEFLNQPYIHYFEKNELVRDIPSLIKNSRYVKKVKYHKDSNPDIIFSHLFELYIKNHRSYLIARESKSGQITFHSITDNPDAMD